MAIAGSIDTSFYIGGGFNEMVYITLVQPDGKILVGGNFNAFNGETLTYFTRLESDGSQDVLFANVILNNNVKAIALDSNGDILVGGHFTTVNTSVSSGLVRLNSNGTPIDYFNPGFQCVSCSSGANEMVVRDVVIQSDGKILVVGSFDRYNGTQYGYIVRLNSDGSVDNTFNPSSSGFNETAYSVIVLPNDNILVGGEFTTYDNMLTSRAVELSPLGFPINKINFDGRVQKIVLQPDGKILFGGFFSQYDGSINSDYLIRLNSDYSVDTTFDSIFNEYIVNMAVQDDGRIIVVGDFNNVYGEFYSRVVRLNPSGSLDGSFQIGNGPNNQVNSISILNNKNIVIGGRFNSFNSNYNGYMIGLNNDELTYEYQYVYSAQSCITAINFLCEISNLEIYIIGSNVELPTGTTISVSEINSPTLKQCVEIIGETNIAGIPTHEYIQEYNSCQTCFSDLSSIIEVVPCNGLEPILLVASNLFNIGDIISIPTTITTCLEFEDIITRAIIYNDCFRITGIFPYQNTFTAPITKMIEYQPQQSCDYCLSCIGKYYTYAPCQGGENDIILAHQYYEENSVLLFQSGDTSCIEVIGSSPYIQVQIGEYTNDYLTCPVINSTVVYDNCYDCLGLWSAETMNNGGVDYNPVEPPFSPSWLIKGPDGAECNDGYTYIKKQFTTSGSIILFYDFTLSTDLCCDWPFYYTSPLEPIGDLNVNFSEQGSGNIFGPDYQVSAGTVTINYNAGDWVSIGVASSDCQEGPGLLYISIPNDTSNNYSLYEYTTCDGVDSFVYVPNSSQLFQVTEKIYTPITNEGLNSLPIGERDDDFIEINFPSGFSVNFLCDSYNSVFMSTNAYITFSGGTSECCFGIPEEIPTQVGLPGVFISTSYGPSNPTNGMDDYLFEWYSGLTNGGNELIIRFEGTYLQFDESNNPPPLIYSFIFYKNQPSYFDLVIQDNIYFYNDNPTGGVSNGVSYSFLATFDSSSNKSYRIESICPVIKSNIGNTPSVCGSVGNSSPGISEITEGSFNFEANARIDIGNDGTLNFTGNTELTIEWFQYWEVNTSPDAIPFSMGDGSNNTVFLQIQLTNNGIFRIGNGVGSYDNYYLNLNLSTLDKTWVHFAITRTYNGTNNIWSVFVDGIMVLNVVNNTETSNDTDLYIGGQSPANGQYQFDGYITNFRINDQFAFYTSNFTVPTSPLQLLPGTLVFYRCINATNFLENTGSYNPPIPFPFIPFSTNSPFVFKTQVFYSDVTQVFNTCNDCNELYGVTLKECRTGEVTYTSMSFEDIQNIINSGPIFAGAGVNCYELLDYCIVPHTLWMTPAYFYNNCESCYQPLSAGTEYVMCVTDCSGNTFTMKVEHPTWTRPDGKAVTLLDAIQLGGINGYYS